MARGKYLSLEEARKLGQLDQFAREHRILPKEQHPRARERFERVLDLACRGTKAKGSKEAEQT